MPHSSHSPQETRALAKRLVQDFPQHRIWLLEGDLAAGKTELVKGLAEALGITEAVLSPTFAYLNHYGDDLAHYDLYRLEGPDAELLALLSEDFEREGYVAIEWPSRMDLPIAASYLHLHLSHEGGDQRRITVTPHPIE